MFFFPALTAVFLLGVGISALTNNSKRAINRVLAAICFAGVLYFAAQLTAKYEGARYVITGTGSPLLWIRVKFAIVAIISPALVWLCFYVLSGRYADRRELVRKMIPWVGLSCILAGLAFTKGFKPDDSLPGQERYGPLFAVYFVPILIGQIAVCFSSITSAKRLTGLRKLEFQFIALAMGYLSLAAVAVELCYAIWLSPWLQSVTRIVSYLVYVAFGISALSVTSHRVYHRQQVFLTIVRRVLVIGPVAVLAWRLAGIIERFESGSTGTMAAVTVVGMAMVLALSLDDWIRNRFRLNAENQINEVSSELHGIAQRQSSPAILIEHFEHALAELSKTPVRVLLKEGGEYGRGREAVPVKIVEDKAAVSDGWYSLTARSRVSEVGGHDLRTLLEQKKWAALIFPGWETNPSLVLAIAERENNIPFTFPELRALRSLTNVVESLYSRCLLALQARQTEQLAAIGKLGVSLAHELRNPMWTLSSFSQLLPERINDPAFLANFAAIVPEEAKRIEALLEQLLDLARPREYNLVECDVHAIIVQTLTLIGPQMAGAGVEVVTRLKANDPNAVVDKDAIRQLLLNLTRNATEALQANPLTHRKIEIRTLDPDSRLQIEIEDNGPGIPDAVRSKLFTAFASVGKKLGLGLGLAVCKEIVAVHSGEITASSSVSGGTLITVVLPRRTGAISFLPPERLASKTVSD